MICCCRVVEPGKGYASIFKHVHHICERSQAPGKFETLVNVVVLCALCHSNVHTASEVVGSADAALLAAKSIHDPEGYSLDRWNAIYGKFISAAEVQAARDAHYLHQLENIRRIKRGMR